MPKNQLQTKVNSLNKALQNYKDEIARALPSHLNANRMTRIILTEIRKNPKLLDCTPESFFGSVIQASQLGLEVGSGLGHGYLVPYGKECQFIPGYKGFIDLAIRTGKVHDVSAEVVHENDEFYYELGTNRVLKHIPNEEDPGDVKCAYATATMDNGFTKFVVLSKADIDKRKSYAKTKNVWNSHYEEMAKKSAVRAIAKYLPMSPEIIDLQRLDDSSGDKQSNDLVLKSEQLTIDYKDIEDIDTQTTIKEVSQDMKAENEAERKKKAIEAFGKRVKELQDIGFQTAEIAKALGVKNTSDVLLKDAATIESALEVMADFTEPN